MTTALYTVTATTLTRPIPFHTELSCVALTGRRYMMVWPRHKPYHYNIQGVPEKRKPINQVNFSENCNDLSRTNLHVYKIQFILFLLTPVTRCIAWPCMAKHEPFQILMSTLICAEYEFKGLTGSATFQNQRDVLKRHSLAFLLSLLSCFFCLDSLFWHGLASLNLVIYINSSPLFYFWHAWNLNCSFSVMPWEHRHVFGIKWKKRKCPW